MVQADDVQRCTGPGVWWTTPDVDLGTGDGRPCVQVRTEVHVDSVDAALRLAGLDGVRLRLNLIRWRRVELELEVRASSQPDPWTRAVTVDGGRFAEAVDRLTVASGVPSETWPGAVLAPFADAGARGALVHVAFVLADSAETVLRLAWGHVAVDLEEGC